MPPLSSMEASWRAALAGEFSKPYYTKVPRRQPRADHVPQLMAFLAAQAKVAKVYPPGAAMRAAARLRPAEGEVFGWSQGCPVGDVKVVVLGQDPYHGPGQAHGLPRVYRSPITAAGLCFSVKMGVKGAAAVAWPG